MIAFIKGVLAGKGPDTAYVEVAGIGYALGMATVDLARLPEVGSEVTVHTYLQVREDALALFGFLTLEEKSLFLRLIGVSGVGPKVALAALSAFSPDELGAHIMAQDIPAISCIPGVGKKTASRIVVELKGSLEKDQLHDADGGAPPASTAVRDAREALLSMGFSVQEADLALKGASGAAGEAALLQYALKRLGT
ncbi:MAG: Holliday junction branch migration protein RuvA [Eggerthellaceae bacterium]|jgi:Holliday junction DNA helicase RuvA|nr:Holliday junction branch migration protein RuvA [Eggerthellaceae bacterium]MDR2715952.1 Holliday junction branch migration protein RuvA [Coriobacteriaceae bacterium]